ncbi:gliding motility protein GldB-related protein [Pontibacter cellulosilyticus]|uniref:DUF2268 domain-containing protein n=1 Tax=Pontibacter cellulosilyticus TaxID=1720253 RepID=A0A923N9Z0_9BACT|nr:DUF2268 domain-containing putative Zn-dependent protease [Pontibacter cellulosilyticus]MBC5994923.1 hypothetical protein [Pontibacter cellulosilyticus]
MKKIFLLAILACSMLHVCAQNTAPLNTPLSWLREARSKASVNDASGTFTALENAVKFGLFDTAAVSRNKQFVNTLSPRQMQQIKAGVLTNRKKLAKPSAIKVHTHDINNFWDTYALRTDPVFKDSLFNNYILDGTVGLKTFYQIRMNNSLDGLVKKVNNSPSFYNSIRDVSKQFDSMKPQFVAAAKKLEKLYPESIFPPIYFIMGHLNNVGTADGYAGLLIGTEHLCRSYGTDTTQLSDFDKMVLFDSTLAVPLIVHEYVHFQQSNKPESSLLELTIMEGVADFITYQITGRYTNPDVFKYGFKNETTLKKHFSQDMQGENTDNWLFNGYNSQTGYPGNLGYFIGFRICENYYQKSANKKEAIKELLNIRDFNQLLLKSGYLNI